MSDNQITILLWSLPVAISLHVFEEFAFPGGLKQWIRTYRPRKPKGNWYYVAINAFAIVLAALLAWTARDYPGSLRGYLYFAALVAGNGAAHIRGTLQTRRYCPGIVSGGALLIPIFALNCWHFLAAGTLGLASTLACIAVGAFIGFYVFGVDRRKQA